jgi:hypothetical protein
MRFKSIIALGLVAVLVTPMSADENDPGRSKPLTHADFKALHKELQPADKPWRTIPWKIALLDAQQTAAKSKKPIFIWAMDGHPLGCT